MQWLKAAEQRAIELLAAEILEGRTTREDVLRRLDAALIAHQEHACLREERSLAAMKTSSRIA
jgi:hypothetical protein